MTPWDDPNLEPDRDPFTGSMIPCVVCEMSPQVGGTGCCSRECEADLEVAGVPRVASADGGEQVATTVNRRDITLEEDFEYVTIFEKAYFWVARLSGNLSTGETAEMSRVGGTSAEALANLESAIAEQGWVIES